MDEAADKEHEASRRSEVSQIDALLRDPGFGNSESVAVAVADPQPQPQLGIQNVSVIEQ